MVEHLCSASLVWPLPTSSIAPSTRPTYTTLLVVLLPSHDFPLAIDQVAIELFQERYRRAFRRPVQTAPSTNALQHINLNLQGRHESFAGVLGFPETQEQNSPPRQAYSFRTVEARRASSEHFSPSGVTIAHGTLLRRCGTSPSQEKR